MNDISALACSVIAVNQSDMQQQIEMSLLRKSAQADREMADVIIENAKRIEELSKKAEGSIDLYT